ncbi:MAG: TonB-dependent receptor [Sphingobacterium sp.]
MNLIFSSIAVFQGQCLRTVTISIVSVLVMLTTIVSAQDVTLRIQNQQNDNIEGASIRLDKKVLGMTNQNGEFLLDVSVIENKSLLLSAIGYQNLNATISPTITSALLTFTLTQDNKFLDEVIVTAGRKVENINTVPSSVTILNQKEIDAQLNISSNLATMIGNAVPGLGTSTNKANNSGQTLRGRQVLVLIDGIPQSTPLMNGSKDIRTIDPGVIERIEVIKGATSIYGNGSGGGIINYITKKNNNAKQFGGTTSIGTSFSPLHADETIGYRVAQTFTGTRNKWNYTVGGSLDYTGLLRDADGTPLGQVDGLSNTRSYNGFLKVGYDINDHSGLTLLYNYFGSTQHAKYISETGVYGQTPTIGIEGADPGKPAGTPYNHNAMLTYSNSKIFSNTALDVTAYVNSFSSMNRFIAMGSSWYGPGQTMIKSNKKGLRTNFNSAFNIGNIPSELTYGLDLLNDVTYQDLVDGRVYIPKLSMVNLAPYAQLKMDFFENLIFKGGIRYENATVRVKSFNTIATGPDNEGSISVSGGDIPYKATMFNAGLRFNRFDIFNPFVSFSQGFAINELGRVLRRAKENTLEAIETDPIITNNYEAGFSSRYKMLNFTAAYYISTSELGVNLVDVGGFLMAQREPERVSGFEFTLDAALSQKLSVGGSYAYVEGKAELDNGDKIYLNGSRIAPAKATAFIYYYPTRKWDLQLFWVHTGSRDRFDVNDTGRYNNSEGPIKNVDLFNLSSSYAFNPQWELSLGIENIFNTSYYPTVSQYRALDAEYVRGNGTRANLNLHFKF